MCFTCHFTCHSDLAGQPNMTLWRWKGLHLLRPGPAQEVNGGELGSCIHDPGCDILWLSHLVL